MSNHQPVVDGGVTGKLPAPRPSVGSWRVPPSPWEQPRSRAGLDRRIPVSPSSAPRKLSLGGLRVSRQRSHPRSRSRSDVGERQLR